MFFPASSVDGHVVVSVLGSLVQLPPPGLPLSGKETVLPWSESWVWHTWAEPQFSLGQPRVLGPHPEQEADGLDLGWSTFKGRVLGSLEMWVPNVGILGEGDQRLDQGWRNYTTPWARVCWLLLFFLPTSEVGKTVTGAGFFLSCASEFHWNVYTYLLLWSWAVGRAGSRGACLWT